MTVLALALAISLTAGIVANARGVEWCEDDPIVTLDGRQFQMVTGFPASGLDSLVGPVVYRIEIPANVENVTVAYPRSVVPSRVEIVRTLAPWIRGSADMIKVKVTVSVNATATFDFVTTVFGPAVEAPFSVSGTSNESQRFGVALR